MLKRIAKIIFFVLLIAGIIFGYIFYQQYQRHLEQKRYEASIVDTSSPTVYVLRDSIFIGYQDQKRTLHLYLPPEYHQDSSKRYPVIYMMDGESSFNDMENMSPEWEIDEVINQASEAGNKTAIVVGINQAEDRDAEYSPFVDDDNPNAHGEEFANWVADELKVFIDTTFRTNPSATATTIGGISRSGMMAYYMLMARPDVFGNAIIQSPSMWVAHDRLLDMKITEEQLSGKKIFISVGEKEGGPMIPHAKEVYTKFKLLGLDEQHLKFEIIADEGHWHPTWRKSFALAYPWMFK